MSPPDPKPNLLTRILSPVSSPLGFTHSFNFIFFVIFGGALFGFTLARLPYLSFSSGLCPQGAGSLDCYYYTPGSIDKIGIMMHLSAILPAALLAILQFIPKIRHRLIIFHRINGYIILLLAIISTIGAFMTGQNMVGGEVSAQTIMGVAGTMFIVSMGLAWWNVKKLQIEQHRAWMLRAWFYAGSIISMRLIMMIMVRVLSDHRGSRGSVAMHCAKITYFLGGSRNATMARYPDCGSYFSGEDPDKFAAVKTDLRGDVPSVISLYTSTFGTALWVALAIHAIGVEIYVSSLGGSYSRGGKQADMANNQLHLTPAEAERLRNVSYQRQLEAGMKNPGRMGLTADKLGYAAKWVPRVSQVESEPDSVSVLVTASK